NLKKAVAQIEAMRIEAGDDFDILIDAHGLLTPAMALEYAKAIEPYRVMFLEEPVQIEGFDSYEWLGQHTTTPLATGERHLTKWGFEELISRHLVSYVQPDVIQCGGITEMKKIAAMAEARRQKGEGRRGKAEGVRQKAEGRRQKGYCLFDNFRIYGIKHTLDLIDKIENTFRLFSHDIGRINTDFQLCLQFIQRPAGYLQKTDIVPGRISSVSLGNIAWNGYSAPSDLRCKSIKLFFRKLFCYRIYSCDKLH
ncbi:unnamed protein product, partial [marine sediment metagenome]